MEIESHPFSPLPPRSTLSTNYTGPEDSLEWPPFRTSKLLSVDPWEHQCLCHRNLLSRFVLWHVLAQLQIGTTLQPEHSPDRHQGQWSTEIPARPALLDCLSWPAKGPRLAGHYAYQQALGLKRQKGN